MSDQLAIVTTLRTEQLQGRGPLKRLTADLVWSDCGELWGVPKGFISDGPSIPWFAPERGPWEYAACPHDFGYRFGFLFRFRSPDLGWEKVPTGKRALDALYRDLAVAAGTSRRWAKTMRSVLGWWPGTAAVWMRYRVWNKPWMGGAPTYCPEELRPDE